MADDLDNLEPQLIAYLDGQLSPADAASLEQQLAADPRYSGLLDDLRQQQKALQGLAPEAAPEALKAGLQLQVNQATLGSEGLSHRRVYRIAASILLTLGAGIVVYQLLPQGGGEVPRVAMNLQQPLVTHELTMKKLPGQEEQSGPLMAMKQKDATADRPVEVAAAKGAPASPNLPPGWEAAPVAKSEAVPGIAVAQVQSKAMLANSSNAMGLNRTVINVATDNPSVLQAEIGRLLRDNRIAYSQEDQIPDGEVVPSSTVNGAMAADELQKQQIAAARDVTVGGGAVANDRLMASDRRKQPEGVEKRGFAGKLGADAEQTPRREGKVAADKNRSLADQKFADADGSRADTTYEMNRGAKAAAPVAAPSAVTTQAGVAATVTPSPVSQAAQQVAQAARPSQTAARQGQTSNAAPSQQVLVARNVSAGDVAQIEQALRQRQVGQRQQLNYRVTETSNSQIAKETTSLKLAKTDVQERLATTTQPTQPAAGGFLQALPADTSAKPTAQQASPATGEKLDLLIVVEPEAK